jgi:hypothetical protein
LAAFKNPKLDNIQRRENGEMIKGTGSLHAAQWTTVEKQIIPEPSEAEAAL